MSPLADSELQDSVEIVVSDNGTIEIDTRTYLAIQKYLPATLLSEGPSQAGAGWPGMQHRGDTVALITRAFPLVRAACQCAGLSVPSRFDGTIGNLQIPQSPTSALLSPTIAADSTRLLQTCLAGQFVAADHAHALHVARAIMAHFSTGQFLFPVDTRARARELAQEIRRRTGEGVEVVYGTSPQRPRERIVVATYQAAACCVNYGPYALMCLLQSGTLHRLLLKHICVGDWARLYVIRPRTLKLPKGDIDELYARLGPVLSSDLSLSLPRSQSPAMTSPEVYQVAFGGNARRDGQREPAHAAANGAVRSVGLDPNKAFVTHDARNRLIAELADQLRQFRSDSDTIDGDVFVVAYSDSHVRQIRRWLRSPDVAETALRPLRVISLADADNMLSQAPAWLIYAAGNPPSKWLQRWVSQQASLLQQVRLVDLTDDFHPVAAKQARARLAAFGDLHARRRPLPNAVLRFAWRAASGRPVPRPAPRPTA